MPIRPENMKRYPKNWKEITKAILQRANNKCEKCGVENKSINPRTGSKVVLTVAHLDHTPENCDPDNLRAWCQKCHLDYDLLQHIKVRKENRINDIKGRHKTLDRLRD